MFFSHIQETRRLNRLDLHSYQGKRLYYSKTLNYISLISKIVFVIMLPVTAILIRDSKNEAVLGFIFLSCFAGILAADSIFESIGRILLKNPVFILKGENLFYLRTNQSYDIRNYSFNDEYIGRHNYFGTFCMIDKNQKRIIAEKNWHLADEETFKSQLKYHQLLLAREADNR